jgi:hypothetical protein
MECPQCQFTVAEDARVCAQCGHVLNEPASPQGDRPGKQTDPQPGAEPAPPPIGLPLDHKPLFAWNYVIAAIPLAVAVLALFMTLGVAAVSLLLRRDWAESALLAAIMAVLGIVAVVIASTPLLILRRFEWVSLGLTALLLWAMVLASVGALTQQSALHHAQGQFWEELHSWPGAIDEYRRSGERQGHAPNMARVRLKWGEQLLGLAQYEDAVTVFRLAQLDDESMTVQERAERGLYRAYTGWLAATPPDNVWGEIASFLERYLTQKLCDAACQKTTRPSVALAYYQSGKQLLKTGLCSDAVTLYRRMASQYAETPSGKQAATDLVAPVTFTATIVDLPGKYKGASAHLSHTVSPNDPNNVRYISEDYQATLGSDGQATFHDVAPDKYNFSFDLPRGEGYTFHFWYVTASPFDPYSAIASPLCGGDETYTYS